MSCGVSLISPARMTPSACLALRAPTIAPVTAGRRRVQGMGVAPGVGPQGAWSASIARGDVSQTLDQLKIWREPWLVKFGAIPAPVVLRQVCSARAGHC